MTAINSNRAIRGPVTAVPVVTGKGVRLVADTENNRWVVEADETVLWDGNGTSSTSVSLSENIANFERVRVTWVNNNYLLTTEAAIHGSTLYFGGAVFGWNSNDGSRMQISGGNYTISNNGTTLTSAGGNQVYFGNSGSSYGGQAPKDMALLKVVGINRVSGGN